MQYSSFTTCVAQDSANYSIFFLNFLAIFTLFFFLIQDNFIINTIVAEELKNFEAEVRAALPDMKFFTFDPLPLFIVCHTGPNAMACGYYVDNLGVLENYNK